MTALANDCGAPLLGQINYLSVVVTHSFFLFFFTLPLLLWLEKKGNRGSGVGGVRKTSSHSARVSDSTLVPPGVNAHFAAGCE